MSSPRWLLAGRCSTEEQDGPFVGRRLGFLLADCLTGGSLQRVLEVGSWANGENMEPLFNGKGGLRGIDTGIPNQNNKGSLEKKRNWKWRMGVLFDVFSWLLLL